MVKLIVLNERVRSALHRWQSKSRLLQKRCTCLSLSILGLAAVLHTGLANAATPNLSGVWWIENFEPTLMPSNGSPIPFTAQGLAQYQKNQDDLQNKKVEDKALTRCLPEALPRAMNSAYPLQIAQNDKLITIVHEENHEFWFINMNQKHPSEDDLDPSFIGQSIGTWEGNTLVVDSIGFKDSFLDRTGLPHTDQLHVIQRLRQINAKQLETVMTIEDPTIYTGPWVVRRTYELRPDVRLMEYVCGETHRYLPGNLAKGVILKWVAK